LPIVVQLPVEIRSLKKWGFNQLLLFEADRDSLHVTLADEAVCIGAAPASQSYLNIEKILKSRRRQAHKRSIRVMVFYLKMLNFVICVSNRALLLLGQLHSKCVILV
jgi:biotin carboxylase